MGSLSARATSRPSGAVGESSSSTRVRPAYSARSRTPSTGWTNARLSTRPAAPSARWPEDLGELGEVVAVLVGGQRRDVGVGDLGPGGDLHEVVVLVALAEPGELGRGVEDEHLAVAAQEAGDVLDVAAQGHPGALGDDDLHRQDADGLPELPGLGHLGGGGGDPAAPGDRADAGLVVVDQDDVVGGRSSGPSSSTADAAG